MATREYTSAVIASAGSVSGTVLCGEGVPVALIMPAAWTAASITFQGSADNSTFNNLYDESGSEITFTVSTSRWVSIPATYFAGIRFLRLRSGTSGVPVAQAADRTITVVTRREPR